MNPTKRIRLVLLPGLHGTDALFHSFIDLCPPDIDLIPFSYPTQELHSYESLSETILQTLDGNQSNFVILGESFSGPLALFVANRRPKGLAGVILAASFVLPPRKAWARWLPWELGCKFAKPAYGLRSMLSRRYRDIILDIYGELHKVSPAVLADRLRSTLSVDATTALRECPVPILYVAASRDIIVRKSSLKQILAIRNDVSVRTIDAPHFVMPSAPAEVWSAIVPFVRGCCAAN
jgi:pimeloyl-[acyl-carrier protein] methyl ester esterase